MFVADCLEHVFDERVVFQQRTGNMRKMLGVVFLDPMRSDAYVKLTSHLAFVFVSECELGLRNRLPGHFGLLFETSFCPTSSSTTT